MAKKKVMMTGDGLAAALKGTQGRIQAPGKRRRTEIQHDAELEGKLSKKIAENARPKQAQAHSNVDSGAIRGIVRETMARVYEEIWPRMETRNKKGDVNLQIAEEAHVLMLWMQYGHSDDRPRVGIPMREIEDFSEQARYCKEHR